CNFLRAILEKTANFLGYGSWKDVVSNDENRAKVLKLLNHYSHSSLSEIENSSLQLEEKAIFIAAFNEFFTKFNWSVNND
ncbi:anticodon nuclease, partial [bacterium]|nr:anticodon nuclease [bacterium]